MNRTPQSATECANLCENGGVYGQRTDQSGNRCSRRGSAKSRGHRRLHESFHFHRWDVGPINNKWCYKDKPFPSDPRRDPRRRRLAFEAPDCGPLGNVPANFGRNQKLARRNHKGAGNRRVEGRGLTWSRWVALCLGARPQSLAQVCQVIYRPRTIPPQLLVARVLSPAVGESRFSKRSAR